MYIEASDPRLTGHKAVMQINLEPSGKIAYDAKVNASLASF